MQSETDLFEKVSEGFWDLAMHKEGCRVVQDFLETSTLGQATSLLGNLRGKMLFAMQDPNANYVQGVGTR